MIQGAIEVIKNHKHDFQIGLFFLSLVICFHLVVHVSSAHLQMSVLNSFSLVSLLVMQRDYLIGLSANSARLAWITASLFGVVVFAAYSGILTSTMISRWRILMY